MRLKLIILGFLLLVLVASVIFAEAGETVIDAGGSVIKLPKTPPLEEKEVPQGQNGTLSLTSFTKSLLKLYEGTRIDFNIYNQDNRQLDSVNSLIITNIKENSVDFLLSVDGSPYTKSTMNLGDIVQLNYTASIPFMFLELRKLRYMEDEGRLIKHVTIYFNVPIFSKRQIISNPIKTVDVENVKTVEGNSKDYSKYYLLGVLGLIVAVFLLVKGGSIINKGAVKDEESK